MPTALGLAGQYVLRGGQPEFFGFSALDGGGAVDTDRQAGRLLENPADMQEAALPPIPRLRPATNP